MAPYGSSAIAAGATGRQFAVGYIFKSPAYGSIVEYATAADYLAAHDAVRFPAPTLDQLKAAQLGILMQACEATIVGGFTSSALGTPHAYPSAMTDQQNLIASITASLLPNLPSDWTTPFWCADTTGTWTFAAHTVDQIQQAGQDGKAAVLASQAKLEGLRQQIAAAASADAIGAITWS